MSAFLQSGRFYPGETPTFRVRFRPEAAVTTKLNFESTPLTCSRDHDYPERVFQGSDEVLTDDSVGLFRMSRASNVLKRDLCRSMFVEYCEESMLTLGVSGSSRE
jgi:hypothetical protein